MIVGYRSVESDDRLALNLEHHRRLGCLRRGGIRTSLDRGHGAERLTWAQDIEDNVLPASRLTQDLHAPFANDAEPVDRVSFGEDELASTIRLLARAAS
jgi:hypothetical protein